MQPPKSTRRDYGYTTAEMRNYRALRRLKQSKKTFSIDPGRDALKYANFYSLTTAKFDFVE